MWTAIAAHIAAHITEVTGQPFTVQDRRSIGGGSINQAYQIQDRHGQGPAPLGHRSYFLKLNQASQVAMFEAEALGLKEIADSHTIRVPRPLCWGMAADRAYIVLDWIDLGDGGADAWYRMGQNLAAMHRVTCNRGFGWRQDNTIGATPQKNSWTPDWLTFYREQRLQYQFQLAQTRGGRFPRQGELLAALPDLLAHHDPAPALVHGDLWSGNAAVSRSGEPVILDPAPYYGDREVDIAMTELFGGFPAAFYEGYNAAYPLDAGYSRRKTLYNLYHILNHYNLFGSGYDSQANRMMEQLLR